MKDIMNNIMKRRIEDKVAFKNDVDENDKKKGG